MSDISLSKAVRSNLLSLQNTADMMATTQNRLATGKKVNSALDNPTNFFTASSLNSRAGDINQLLDGMANGIQTIEAADNGLKAITKTLESMQSTLRQARQDKSFETQSFSLDAESIGTDALKSLTFSGGAISGDVEIDLNSLSTTPVQSTYSATDDFSAPAADPSSPANIVGDPVTALAENDTLTFSLNGVEVSVTGTAATAADAEGTATAIVAAIQGLKTGGTTEQQAALADITVTQDAGALTFASTAEGSEANITLGASGSGDHDVSTLGIDADSYVSEGSDAETFTFSVNGTSISLTNDNAGDLDEAIITINGRLEGTGFVAQKDPENTGRLQIVGPDDGSSTVSITGSSEALEAVFGADDVAATTGVPDQGNVKSVDDLVREINNHDDLKGKIRASNDNGQLRIENLSTQGLDVGGVSTEGEIDGVSDSRDDVIGGNSVRADLAAQFRDLRDQLDKLADDASFNGINLLRGDNLQITFNETGTSEINIRSKDEQGISSSVLKLETNLQPEDLDSDANIDDLLDGIKSALNEVRSQASAFGSSLSVVQNRQDFSKNMINTLQTGAANLTLADSNEEAANLLALQTRQQLSSTALSMASQQDQAVLRLF